MSILQKLALTAAIASFAGAATGQNGVFTAANVETASAEATVPVQYQGQVSLGVAVVTLEYNGRVARLERVEPGADTATWAVAAVNDNAYANPTCQPEEPLRRCTVVLLGDVWCSDRLDAGELVRFVFRREGPGGATPLNFVDTCDSAWMNQGSDCLGETLMVPTTIPGSVAFDATVGVQEQAWAQVKELYR